MVLDSRTFIFEKKLGNIIFSEMKFGPSVSELKIFKDKTGVGGRKRTNRRRKNKRHTLRKKRKSSRRRK